MKIIELGIEEMARTHFTHKAIISYANGDFTAAATTQTYNLGPAIAAGEVVDNAAFRIVTAVSGGAISAATLQVGYTGTTNGLITATSCFTGTAGAISAGGAGLNQANGVAFAAASQLVAVLTTTTANVSVATAGELHVFWARKQLANF